MKLMKLTEHVSYTEHGEGDRPVFGYIRGKYGAVVVDGGCSTEHAEGFLNTLSEDERCAITAVLLTHGHWDHIMGAAAISHTVICSSGTAASMRSMENGIYTKELIDRRFAEGRDNDFAHTNMLLEFSHSGKPVMFIPPFIINEKIRIDLGGVHVVYEPVTTCHCDHAFAVFAEEDRVLFAGDSLWPNMDGDSEDWFYSISAFENLCSSIRGYGAEYIIDSHDRPAKAEYLFGWTEKVHWMLTESLYGGGRRIDKDMPDKLKGYISGYDDCVRKVCPNTVI